VPLFGSIGLDQQLDSKEYGRKRNFRQKLAKWIGELKAWWSECPAAALPDGWFLIISLAKRSLAIGTGTGE